jgi:hypothetical protein
VGARDSRKSSGSNQLARPDITFNSSITLSDGQITKGSSSAAAIAAALAILHFGIEGRMLNQDLQFRLKNLNRPMNPSLDSTSRLSPRSSQQAPPSFSSPRSQPTNTRFATPVARLPIEHASAVAVLRSQATQIARLDSRYILLVDSATWQRASAKMARGSKLFATAGGFVELRSGERNVLVESIDSYEVRPF